MERAGKLFHDLTSDLKEDIHDLRTGEQPVEAHANLIVRRHLNGLIILLFAVTALILLSAVGVLYLYSRP
jgi:hypothetical protein